jgi:hypothetical protein
MATVGFNCKCCAIKFENEGPGTLTVAVDGSELKELGLVTRIEVNQNVAAQFKITFGSNIYVVPFGDKPGDIAISFIANPECSSTSTGLSSIEYYLRNRLRASTGSLQIVSVGDIVFVGSIVGCRIVGDAEQSSPMVKCQLLLKAWPL